MVKKKSPSTVDVAKAFQELESIAQWFESGDADIDKGMAQFERASELAKELKQRLSEAQNRIQEIRGTMQEDL